MKPGAEWGPWKRYLLGALVLAAVIALATPFGGLSSIFVVAGLFLIWSGVRSLRQWRALSGMETKAVGSLHGDDDMVAIEGTVAAADGSVTAPISETETVAYRVEVERYTPPNSGGE